MARQLKGAVLLSVARSRLAVLILLVGIVLSPLRAVAATLPMLVAYNGVVRPTPTVRVEAGPSVRPDAEQAPITDYDDALFGYDAPSRLRLADGSGAVCAYDDGLEHAGMGAVYAYARALEHAERREAVEGAIYDAPAATTAAEGAAITSRGLTAADIGLSGRGLSEVSGTVIDQGATRTLSVEQITAASRGAISPGELRSALPNLLNRAAADGVSTLRIQASFQNNALLSRFATQAVVDHGAVITTENGFEVFTFGLGGQ